MSYDKFAQEIGNCVFIFGAIQSMDDAITTIRIRGYSDTCTLVMNTENVYHHTDPLKPYKRITDVPVGDGWERVDTYLAVTKDEAGSGVCPPYDYEMEDGYEYRLATERRRLPKPVEPPMSEDEIAMWIGKGCMENILASFDSPQNKYWLGISAYDDNLTAEEAAREIKRRMGK